jgi:signal transduction histidine kinase
MKLKPTTESELHNDAPKLPGQWIFYLIAAAGILVSLLLYFSVLHSHTKHEHLISTYQTDAKLNPNFNVAPRIPVLTLPAKQYAIEDLDEILESIEIIPDALESILSYIAPVFGIAIALLLILSLRLMHLARIRAYSLDQANHALKNEIAEREQMEATKQKLEKALLQGQKLQAIGTLAGGIAHDFNNLLYAIIGYTEMAREDVEKDSLLYKNLGKVLEAAHRGQELVSRILTFSRRQSHHEYKAVTLKSTINNVLSLLKPTIPSSVMLNCDLDITDQFMIWGDQTQLHQVLVNIINNAVDAMDGEGLVTIHVSKVLANDVLLKQFPHITAGNYCKIDITDTGYGMDNNTIERIFEPFFTTKEVGKGTGLGLATVHAIIKEHQGEIVVNSQLGSGSKFTIFIPEYSPP